MRTVRVPGTKDRFFDVTVGGLGIAQTVLRIEQFDWSREAGASVQTVWSIKADGAPPPGEWTSVVNVALNS